MGECFNYSFDPRNNRAQLRRLFRRIYEALRPGGVLVFDIVQQGRVPGGSRRNWWEGPD